MRVRGGVIAVLVAVVGFSGAVPAAQAGPQPPTVWGPTPDATTGAVGGTVTSEGGVGVGDVRVEVWDASPTKPRDVQHQVAQDWVAEDGTWNVALAPGRYTARLVDNGARLLDAHLPGGGSIRPSGTFTVTRGATTRFDVRMRPGARISGRVLGPGGTLMRDGVHATLEQRTAKGRWVAAKQPYWQTPVIGPDAT